MAVPPVGDWDDRADTGILNKHRRYSCTGTIEVSQEDEARVESHLEGKEEGLMARGCACGIPNS